MLVWEAARRWQWLGILCCTAGACVPSHDQTGSGARSSPFGETASPAPSPSSPAETEAEPRRPESGGLEADYGLSLARGLPQDVTVVVELGPMTGLAFDVWLRRAADGALRIRGDGKTATLTVSESGAGGTRELRRVALAAEARMVTLHLQGRELRIAPDVGAAVIVTVGRLGAGAASLRVEMGKVHAVAVDAAAVGEEDEGAAGRMMEWHAAAAGGRCLDTCQVHAMLPVISGVDRQGGVPEPLAVCRAMAGVQTIFGLRAGTQAMTAGTRCFVVGGTVEGEAVHDCLCQVAVGAG